MRRVFSVVILILVIYTQQQLSAEEVPELSAQERAWVAKGYTVRILVGNCPPYQLHDGEKLTGVAVDYLKKIFASYGIKYKLVSSKLFSKSEALNGIRNNRVVDMLLAVRVSEGLKQDVRFTVEYIAQPWVVFARKNETALTSFADLSGKKVILENDMVAFRLLREYYPLLNVTVMQGSSSVVEGLRAVAAARAYAFIGNQGVGDYQIAVNGLNNLQIVCATPFGYDYKAMAVRRDWPELVSIIDKSLLNFSQEYKSEVLLKYYREKAGDLGYARVILWVLVIAFVLLSLVFVILFINKQFYSEVERRKDLQAQVQAYAAIIDEHVVTMEVNSEGVITAVSKAFCRLNKYERMELLGKSFLVTWAEGMPQELYKSIYDAVQQRQPWYGEIKKVDAEGGKYWLQVEIQTRYDAAGNFCGFVSTGKDITAAKLIERMSSVDKLTELKNRVKLDEILEYELNQSQRYLHPLSIIFLDIDEFRKINDTHGYQTGDLILKMIARLIQNNSRAADTVGRWGGDRFLLICPETRLEGAKVLARKLLEIIANSYFPKAGSSTASAGLAEYRKDDSQWQLLERAEKALHAAKKKGKNQLLS